MVDDDASLRDSLRVLLEASGFSVETYGTAAEFLQTAPGLAPGCVLTDIRMPQLDGLELQERLAKQDLRLPLIVMTGQGDVPLAVRAMRAGAVDFLEKPIPEARLLEAVGRALSQAREAEAADRAMSEAEHRISALTAREREVFALLTAGLSTKAIAQRLGASPRTIEVHRSRVFAKLQADSLADLVRLSAAAGW